MRTRETFGALQRAISTNQLLTVTVVSIVAVVVLLTSILGHETSRRDRSSAFDRIADQVTERLAKQAPLWMSYARANRDLIALNASPNPVDLLAYEEQLKERFSSVLSATFVPRITDDDRLAHELTMRRQGVSDYEIRDLNANMEFSRATQRLEYFPTYSHGLEGWDIGADPSLAPIIISVQESGEGLARMFAHPLGTNSGIGLVVFSPIYGGQSIPESLEERRREFSGISIISLDTSILIASVIGDLEDEVTVRVMIEQSQPSGLTDHALYI